MVYSLIIFHLVLGCCFCCWCHDRWWWWWWWSLELVDEVVSLLSEFYPLKWRVRDVPAPQVRQHNIQRVYSHLGMLCHTKKKNSRKTILNTVDNLLMIHSKPMVSLHLSCNQVGHSPEPASLKHLAILIMLEISYPDCSHTSNAM